MNEVVNLMLLEPGANIIVSHGATAEVISNPMDGVWVFVKYLSSPDDPTLEGTEDMVFAQDVVRVIESS
jgi:hypothetical protein